MGVLDGFTPEQKKMALYGVPLVAVVVLVSKLRGDKEAARPAAADPSAAIGGMRSTDAIGVGQLAQFETGITASLSELWREVESWRAEQNTTPPAPVPTADQPVATVTQFDVAPWRDPPTVNPPEQLSCIPGWPCAPPGMTASPIIFQGAEIGVRYS